MSQSNISLIAAVDQRGAIGYENAMPWHLPKDFQYFKQQTMGKPMIMGRKTFESFGARPLPGRAHHILSRQPQTDWQALSEVTLWQELEPLLAHINATPDQEWMVIGGGEIYRQLLPFANRLYLTEVKTTLDQADAFFPEWDAQAWRTVSKIAYFADERHAYDFDFVVYEKQREKG